MNDILFVHIDRKRKLPVTVLLKALGFATEKAILELFYPVEEISLGSGKSQKDQSLEGRVMAEDVVERDTGEILIEANEELSVDKIKDLAKAGIKSVKVFDIKAQDEADVIRNTLRKDSSTGEEDALARIYALLRPGESPRAESARDILTRLFFSPKRYDLAKVGRFKLNQKLNQDFRTRVPRVIQPGCAVRPTLTAPQDHFAKADIPQVRKFHHNHCRFVLSVHLAAWNRCRTRDRCRINGWCFHT